MEKFKSCALLCVILGASFVCKNKISNSTFNEMELNNIEALASHENPVSNVTGCFDTGSVECDYGGYGLWTAFKIEKEFNLY